mmetsp:Transcript_1122/g.1806  ORF Transcript_1122/g.1806 Transcript_1122/m.1806 type:complete len:473 (+) Transcript_1122:117-1535(+)
MSGTDDIIATRKLTESETATLRSLLKSQLNIKAGDAQDEEDAGDLLDYAFAMIANGRNVECVKDELKSMELEVCPAESAQRVGRSLSKFLLDLDNKAGGSSQPSDAATPKKESSGKVVTNALTSSGALGSSRQRKTNNDSGNNNSNNNKNDGRRGDGKQQQRSVHGAAFDRLRNTSNNNQRNNNNNNNNNRTQHQSYDDRGRGGPHRPPMNQSRGQNHHERGNDSRRGRDDWGGRGGGGRGGRGHGGRGEPRGGGRGESRGGGGGRGRGGRQDNMSGDKRRQREEEDFVPASPMDRGLQSSRTGDEPMRQGRGGRNNHGDMQSHEGKRARHEEQSNDNNYSQQGNDNWGSNHWQEGRGGRGGRFSRGGGRFGGGRGRFSSTFYPNKQNTEQEGGDGEANATTDAAAVSESPLVAGHFSGRGSFRGRGRGRGRGRFVDGRGRGRGGRSEVAELLSAKTWTRPRTMDEGLSASR